MPLHSSTHQPVVGLSVRADLPKATVESLFAGISFATDRTVVHDGDTYRTYSSQDDALLSKVHRLFGGDINIDELDRRIKAASEEELCYGEMAHGTLIHLSSRSSEADLSHLAALACASLSQQIVSACRELLLALKSLILSHHKLIAEQRTVETSLFIRNGRDLVLVSARFAYQQRRRRWFALLFGCSAQTVDCKLDIRRIRILQASFEKDVRSGSPLLRRILPPSPPLGWRAASAPAKLSSRAEALAVRRPLTPRPDSPGGGAARLPDLL